MTKSARHALLVAPLLSLALAYPAYAQIQFKEITSPGGIKAWMNEDDTLPIITMAFGFKAGAVYEPADKAGLAGLTGAMMREGTKSLDSDAFAEKLEDVGLVYEITADRDFLWAQARATKDESAAAFDLLAEAINAPRFDEKDLDRVKRIGIENIRGISENPQYQASLQSDKAVYGDHPYGRPAEGTIESISSITTQDLAAFYKAGLSRDTLKIGISGDITEEEAGILIDKLFSNLPAENTLPKVAAIEPKLGEKVEVNYDLPQTSLELLFPGISFNDPDYYSATVLTELLGGGMSSLLNTEVREKRGLSYGAYGSMANLVYSDLLRFGTATEPQNSEEALTVINDVFSKIVAEGPEEAEVERNKGYMIGSYAINNLGSTMGIVSTMVMDQLLDRPINFSAERTAGIEAVTVESVKAVAKRILDTKPTIVTVGPEAKTTPAE